MLRNRKKINQFKTNKKYSKYVFFHCLKINFSKEILFDFSTFIETFIFLVPYPWVTLDQNYTIFPIFSSLCVTLPRLGSSFIAISNQESWTLSIM